MLYAALTFWLLVIIFSAWGVHSMWSGLVRPRVINAVLLPGTLVAQLGHVLGLLVTGNSVRNTALMRDDDSGDPQSETPDTQRLPVIGPILIGLLPLLACAICLYFAARTWGGGVVGSVEAPAAAAVAQALPTSIAGFWELLRSGVTAAEQMLDTIMGSDPMRWQTLLFLYLAVCLTVRMTPFEGNRRGAIGAIFLAGLLVGIAGLISPGKVEGFALSSWPLLSFAVGMLLLLLVITAIVTGVVGLVRVLAKNA